MPRSVEDEWPERQYETRQHAAFVVDAEYRRYFPPLLARPHRRTQRAELGWWKHDKVPKFHVGGKWEVIDGVLVGDQDSPGIGGFLATKDKYGDFEIRMEVWLDFPSNTGVFLCILELNSDDKNS